MCGIVGAVAKRNVSHILVEGLKRLEYRGYDSAGIALAENHSIQRLRAIGKVNQLEKVLAKHPTEGQWGIAHTRWATHGKPAEHNAHPHCSHNKIAVVHNGIIENFEALRTELQAAGYAFESDTDSEVVAHLIHFYCQHEPTALKAVQQAIKRLEGAYALGIMHIDYPNELIAARHGSPLVIGMGAEENFIASDPLALLPFTQRFIYLDNGDVAHITREQVSIFDRENHAVVRPVHHSQLNANTNTKGDFKHFMLKEIYDQPQALSDVLEGHYSHDHVLTESFGPLATRLFPRVERVRIVACGTSYHAGLVASYWIESLAGLPCQVDIASEYRYREVLVEPNTLFVTLSQSGETADTLAALHLAKEKSYLASLSICNVPESSLVRESMMTFMTRAGAEIGVASTKAFTTQLTALLLLALSLNKRKTLSAEKEASIIEALKSLPRLAESILQLNDEIIELAKFFVDKKHALYLGRGPFFPIALEGALKLKEISYLHAEAYPAGELKHGPLALVDHSMPVIVLAPKDALLPKLLSNVK
ncbi:MAG TPA: glutamine--fructose-6-phosphate transaminase (isomerizing), partial [Coxiellaceae bacterium]|nr:glutamine--fructose-6-phosphate transaminase (isomerizing) [Coxiellaceae bacterium]